MATDRMQSIHKYFAFLSLSLSLLAIPPAARAGSCEDARDALKLGIDEVSSALRDRPAQIDLIALLDTLANKHFAFETTTRLAVGPGWREFTPDQRAQATELFSRLVIRTYAKRLKGNETPVVSFGTPAELRTNRVEIPSRVTNAGQTYAVTYRLELDQSAGWRIYDVVAEGVSLVSNYRSQFDPIVRREGAKGLIAAIENQLVNVATP